MTIICPHIKAKGKPEFTTLHEHLNDVATVVERIADYLNMDKQIAQYGPFCMISEKQAPHSKKGFYLPTKEGTPINLFAMKFHHAFSCRCSMKKSIRNY
jgi:hypothetical protein